MIKPNSVDIEEITPEGRQTGIQKPKRRVRGKPRAVSHTGQKPLLGPLSEMSKTATRTPALGPFAQAEIRHKDDSDPVPDIVISRAGITSSVELDTIDFESDSVMNAE